MKRIAMSKHSGAKVTQQVTISQMQAKTESPNLRRFFSFACLAISFVVESGSPCSWRSSPSSCPFPLTVQSGRSYTSFRVILAS